MDRVERAWAEHVLDLDRPVFGLARLRRATVLLDRDGLRRLLAGEAAGPARFLDTIRGRGQTPRARAEGDAVRLAVARWPGVPDVAGLSHLLGPLPGYVSVGHAGLDARGLGAISALPGARSAVLVHDTIPLDLPETQKPGASERFARKLRWVARASDVVVAPTLATADDIARHLSPLGFGGTLVVAPPGVVVPVPGAWPPGVPADRPFCLALGTIEPRKNHALLLDLWERPWPGPEAPRLVVVGRRGWRNEAVFARLDALRGGGEVIELNGLDDAGVGALLQKARALVFPSLAEGFGYPPLEAAGLGTPVVASPLPQLHELLGDRIVYADPRDLYQWRSAIGDLAGKERPKALQTLPTWQDHVSLVLRSLG